VGLEAQRIIVSTLCTAVPAPRRSPGLREPCPLPLFG
jgi:hypothetical protein